METNATPTAAPAAEPVQSGQGNSFHVDLTPAQIQTMAQWEVEAGRLTQAQAEEMLNAQTDANTAPANPDQAAEVLPPLQPIPGLPELDLSDPIVASEHAAYTDLPPEGKPYEFDYSGAREIDPAFVASMNELCRALEMPQWMAKWASKQYVKAEADYKAGKITKQSIELSRQKAEFTLRGMWSKPGEYEANVKAAQSLLLALPREKGQQLIEIMELTDMGNSPLVLSHLSRLAQHRVAKGKRK